MEVELRLNIREQKTEGERKKEEGELLQPQIY